MKSKLVFISLICLLVSSLVLGGCTEETTPTPTSKTPAPTASTPAPTAEAHWWDELGEPEYGGTITRHITGGEIASVDPNPWTFRMGLDARIWNEKLFMPDWTVDRDVFSFKAGWTPPDYMAGLLAESWEQTDPQTVVVTIRQGIHWWDKPPVNGREFTADDVVYNYDWMLGTGSGFTEPNPWYSPSLASLKSIVATDKYTVEFKFENPSALNADTLFTSSNFYLAAPEWLELYGSTSEGDSTSPTVDLETVVGTGPWILAEYVPSVSLTYDRNPDYWGYDERHPENQLPYADTLRSVAIDDMSTALAALRTGQVDMEQQMQGPTLQQAQSIADSNPEIQQAFWPQSGTALGLRCDKEPFTDIRVRKALQLAIDLESLAQSYFLGSVEGTPVGLIHPVFADWVTPYDQWPADLQAEYTYNLTKAKELLAEAGYPDGFKTNCIVGDVFDLEMMQVLKSYLMNIGVDMEIKVSDMPTFNSLQVTGTFDQMTYTRMTGYTSGPSAFQNLTSGYPRNWVHNNDPTYDAMYNEMKAATSLDETKRLARELGIYILEQHWSVNTVTTVTPCLWQPWIKGCSGEGSSGHLGFESARLWVDQDMKESMGH